MAKKGGGGLKAGKAAVPQEPAEAQAEETPVPERAPAKPKVWAFPTKSRCPRCGSVETEATSTQGELQYRRCTVPVCRRTYVVYGTQV